MKEKLCWRNIILIFLVHLFALLGVVYLATWKFNWLTVGLGLAWFALCALSITAGYHRRHTHQSYKCLPIVEFLLLMFGAGSVQGSVLWWVSVHQQHHAADRPGSTVVDPHDIQRGFRYAHMGWLFRELPKIKKSYVWHLKKNALAQWQHEHYGAMMVLWGFAFPILIAFLWNDPIGGLLVAGFLRTVVEWHLTWSINSVSHMFGENTFNRPDGSRNSLIRTYLTITLGEGWHSFHHQFPRDYRNGWKFSHIDPTKWFIKSLAFLRLAWDLKPTSEEKIAQALASARTVPSLTSSA